MVAAPEKTPEVTVAPAADLEKIPEVTVVAAPEKTPEVTLAPAPPPEKTPEVTVALPKEVNEQLAIKKNKKLVVESDSESEEENIEKNLDGLSLRSYFQDRIEKYDSPLIIKKDVGNYSTYSKVCQSTTKRQPVILTDDELAKINKEHKGFLRDEDIIKYGSDKNNQFNYICPRYWCLKTNSPIDPNEFEETVENGKKVLVHPTCGKILPSDRKSKDDKIIPGHYVYEFYKEGENKRYPGFQTDKHPKGFCLPCCFDKYNTVGRIEAKEKCSRPPEQEKEQEEEKTKKKKQKRKQELEEELEPEKRKEQEKRKEKEERKEDEEEKLGQYILGPEKFPLQSGRWGYLPVALIQLFSGINIDCQMSKTDTTLNPNHPCLLRHGVELSENQSFIACISNAIFFSEEILDKTTGKKTGKMTKILSIQEMRNLIIKSLTIDNFIKYQNGNLVTDFYDPNKDIDMDNLNEKYTKNVKLYSKLNMTVEADRLFYKKVIAAFENFINFLKDDDAVIDHTYLWDLVSIPGFTEKGFNLIIFEITNNDITNNVQLICPNNHYSTKFYDAHKETLFLLKEDNYYEPIYSYTDKKIRKRFTERDPHLIETHPTIKSIFNEIIPVLDRMCKPLPSMPPGGLPPPKVYDAKTPLLLNNLVDKIKKYEGYEILKLVINFHNKVIGVLVKNTSKDIKCFVPCYPSRIENKFKEDTIDYVLMTDLSIWNTYDNTVEFLINLDKRDKGTTRKGPPPYINCAPAFNIIEEELIVGILTETNQFIQLSEPISEEEINTKYKNIPSFRNTNYVIDPKAKPIVQSDVLLTTSNKVDEERVDYIKKIKFETNFYNVFRNTIRILLNDYENNEIKQKIEAEMFKEYIIYSQKLKNISKLLKDLINDKILFNGDDNYYKLIDEVSTCLVKDEDSCSKSPNLCAVTENGKCKLILPKRSLIAYDKIEKKGKLNEPIYLEKMADELIRYNRIKSFMLEPQTYLSFGNVGYNLRDNEIIMLQSLLTQEYFENITPVIINKYVKYNSYDEAEPIITQPYDDPNNSNTNIIKNKMNECKNDPKPISSGKWKICFPSSFKEIKYNKSNYCTFVFIIDLIEKKTGKKLSDNEIRNVLHKEYIKYFQDYHAQIIDNLIFEGKHKLGNYVKNPQVGEKIDELFLNLIYNTKYFLTTFDLWILVQKFQIPTIFISTSIKSLVKYNSDFFFVGYGNEDDNFAFIVVPGIDPVVVHGIDKNQSIILPSFKIIQTNSSDVFISFDKLLDCEYKNKFIESFKNKITIEYFLRNFSKKIRIETSEPSDDDEPVKKTKKATAKQSLIEGSIAIPENKEPVITKEKTKKNKKEATKGKTKKVKSK